MSSWKSLGFVPALMVVLSGCTTTSINHPPSIDSFDPGDGARVPEGGSATFRVNATDTDGQKLVCRWYLDGALNLTGETPFVFVYSPGRAVGEHCLTAEVSDGSLTAVRSWKVEVFKVNHPPAILESFPADSAVVVNEGGVLDLSVNVSDSDGDQFSLWWYLDGTRLPENRTSCRFAPNHSMAGPHVVRLVASDGLVAAEKSWNILVKDVDRAPRITDWLPPGDLRIRETETRQFWVAAEDDDGDPVSYRWEVDLTPAGEGQNFNFTPDYLSAGNRTVTAFASDGRLEANRSWKVSVENLNRIPFIGSFSPAGDISMTEYETVPFGLSADDPDGDQLTVNWFVDDGPVAAGKGEEFAFTPGYDSVGNHTVRAELTDGTALLTRYWNVSVSRARANWTVLAYMNGDNDLEPYIIGDFNEMEVVGSSPRLNIVAQLDRHPSYDFTCDNWNGTRRYRVERGSDMSVLNSSLLLDLGELDMGAEATLRDFLLWGFEKFPADRYQVVLSGHGDGWYGISQDFTDGNDKLSLSELASALRSLVERRGAGIEVLELDVCYWAMMESDHALEDLASYIVGSEDIDPSPGQEYRHYLHNLSSRPGMGPRELAVEIVDSFRRGYSEDDCMPEDNETFTQSAVETARLPALASALDRLCEIVTGNISALVPAVGAARQGVETYGKPEFIDLYEFTRLLRQASNLDDLNASADAVMAGLSSAVVAEAHGFGRPRSHGISIYFPAQSYSYRPDYSGLNFSADHHWNRLLREYYNATGGRGEDAGPEPEAGPPPPAPSPVSVSERKRLNARMKNEMELNFEGGI